MDARHRQSRIIEGIVKPMQARQRKWPGPPVGECPLVPGGRGAGTVTRPSAALMAWRRDCPEVLRHRRACIRYHVCPCLPWLKAVYAMNNLVALDTSTEYLSLTVAAGSVLRSHHAQVGQQHGVVQPEHAGAGRASGQVWGRCYFDNDNTGGKRRKNQRKHELERIDLKITKRSKMVKNGVNLHRFALFLSEL